MIEREELWALQQAGASDKAEFSLGCRPLESTGRPT